MKRTKQHSWHIFSTHISFATKLLQRVLYIPCLYGITSTPSAASLKMPLLLKPIDELPFSSQPLSSADPCWPFTLEISTFLAAMHPTCHLASSIPLWALPLCSSIKIMIHSFSLYPLSLMWLSSLPKPLACSVGGQLTHLSLQARFCSQLPIWHIFLCNLQGITRWTLWNTRL